MAFMRKRSRSVAPFRRNVRRRSTFVRRRRVGGRRFARKTSQYMTHGNITSPLQFRSRMMRRSAFRRRLWNDTLIKTHYKSRFSLVETPLTTGTTQAVGPLAVYGATSAASSAIAFWLATGGAVAADTGDTVPRFEGDIILRGGKIGINFSVASSIADPIKVRVWLVYTTKRPTTTSFPATFGLGTGPYDITDFSGRYGKVLLAREAILGYENQAFNLEYRLRPQKIDQDTYLTADGNTYRWLVNVVNLSSSTDVTVDVVKYYNLSFSGDAEAVSV